MPVAASETSETSEAAERASEEVIEDIVEVAEALAPILTCCTVNARETELVILGLLVRVAEDRVCLRGLLELALRGLLLFIGTAYPAVWMPLEGSLSVGRLYFIG